MIRRRGVSWTCYTSRSKQQKWSEVASFLFLQPWDYAKMKLWKHAIDIRLIKSRHLTPTWRKSLKRYEKKLFGANMQGSHDLNCSQPYNTITSSRRRFSKQFFSWQSFTKPRSLLGRSEKHQTRMYFLPMFPLLVDKWFIIITSCSHWSIIPLYKTPFQYDSFQRKTPKWQ